MPVERWIPDHPAAGVVLVPPGPAIDALARDWATRLAARGFAVLIPEMGWRARGAEELSDAEAIADVAAARDLLPTDVPRFVLGLGAGGLYARLAACAVLGFTGALDLGGRMHYSGVSARRPIQPLDLLPGLGCALQCHFAALDPATPLQHVDDLERRLAASGRPWQVLRYPGRGAGFLDPASSAWHREDAATAWARCVSFLAHLADGPA